MSVRNRSAVKVGPLSAQAFLLAQANTCFYCTNMLTPHRFKAKFNEFGWTVDHVIPRSIIKSNSLNNIVFSCDTCNNSKRDILPSKETLSLVADMHRRRREILKELKRELEERQKNGG
jgi:5-methylcytosine-specific restriction endonuclease McrA